MTDTRTVVYADGWDGSVVNPLSPTEAEARDTMGRPYAVLLLADGRPEWVGRRWLPTWVGRDAEGGVACFVADMLL